MKAHIVGGGFGGLAAAAYLIRNAGVSGEDITVYEAQERMGGSFVLGGSAETGYILPCGAIFDSEFRCTFDLMATIPSTRDPAVSVTDEFFKFNADNPFCDRVHILGRNGPLSDIPHFGLGLRDGFALARLSLTPEAWLDGREIKEFFRPSFFSSEFWWLWSTLMGSLPQHSATEFRRYINRALLMFPDLSDMSGILRTPLNQYQAFIAPLVAWLQPRGVNLLNRAFVTDIGLAPSPGRLTVDRLDYERDGASMSVAVAPDDIVLVTTGSEAADLALGSMTAPPRVQNPGRSWALWKRLAQGRADFGNPDVFFGESKILDSRWVSFTITTRGTDFIGPFSTLTKSKPGSGGLVTLKDSNWVMSLSILGQPEVIGQPDDTYICWGYGLFPQNEGRFVPKPMHECTGAEILRELVGQLGFTDRSDAIMASSICIPSDLPYVNNIWMPRSGTDRPPPVPQGSTNLGLVGQYVEVPREVAFTIEYSARTAWEAIRVLLKRGPAPPRVYQGQFDPTALFGALRVFFGRRTSSLPPRKKEPAVRRFLRYLVTTVVGLYVLAAVLYAVPMIAGVLDDTMAVKFDRPDASLVADYSNGLTPAQKESYYHLSQGAEILPWFLLTAVDVADPGSSKPFVENLGRYGLLPDPARSDGLPVGLTVASNRFTFGMDFVGITCAACHVGELRHDGKAVRVDGAPNMFNLQLFYADAIAALTAATSDRGKLWRALKRMGRQDYARYSVAAPFVRPATLIYYGVNVLLHRDRLNARLELVAVIRSAKERRDPEHPTSGFGRLDAFDGTRNFIFTRLRKADAGGSFVVNKLNMVKLDAPVKFPPLWSRKAQPPEPVEAYRTQPDRFPRVWGFKDYDWVEWTIDTNTVMERNVTETLGAGATVVLDPNASSLFESSIPIQNMHDLEWLAYYMDPPRWPTAVFGAIKPDLAAEGASIFQSRCASCHEYGDDQRTPTGLIKLRGMRLEDVGTDATAALRISCPVPDTGALTIPPRSYSVEDSQLLKDCTGVKAGAPFTGNAFAATVKVAVDGIKQKAYAADGIAPAQQRIMEDVDRRGAVAWRDTLLDARPPSGPYAARPLYGIWAAAPFLHNGSVPTLYDLLRPPAQRPTTFALGAREYDPVKLGFVVTTSCSAQDCLVDTTRPGNGNGGHLWGTDLSEPDRMALLEYLKTY